jgi:hypothetical protein
MEVKKHDILSLALIALIAVLPLVSAAPASYGLSQVGGAWVGLLSVAAGAIAGIVLNRNDSIGDGK